jgi:hypothetical protein
VLLQDVTREVALKAIPKKKVKGNEESVWTEMRVLQGLDHSSIVRSPLSSSHMYASLLVKGQILRVVRVEVHLLSLFRTRRRRGAL